MPTIEFDCSTCFKHTVAKRKHKNNNNFCSKDCYHKYLVKTPHVRVCLRCAQKFVLNNIAYEKRGHGKYCSMDCSKFATKKYSFDEKFFDNIDTENKAYWLGFCMADACNTTDELRIELSAKDENHLLKFKNDIVAEQNITYRYRGEHKMSSIGLSSRYMCKSLSRLGCIKNKSFDLTYPEIPSILDKDFIRGFFDGDGCIYVRTPNRTWSIFSVSKDFLFSIKDKIENAIDIKPSYYEQNINGHLIVIRKKNDIEKLYHYLYDGATIFMDRKKNKFSLLPQHNHEN